MFNKLLRQSWPIVIAVLLVVGGMTRETARSHHDTEASTSPSSVVAVRPTSLVRSGDRLAWVGSSSTNIGVWPKTVEFLLRTRHPGLDVAFQKFSTGGGTFQTGVENLDSWLDEFEPSLVVFNYGGNDAGSGFQGLGKYRDRMGQCVAKVRSRGARTILVTPQALDPRKAGRESASRLDLYADVMLEHGREQGWTVLDVHEPLAALQRNACRDDPGYSILKDRIHLTDPGYLAWGFAFYDRLDLPRARSVAMIGAQGKVIWTSGCEIRDVETTEEGLAFSRIDRVLPILPPGPLPPRHLVPMETHSAYQLRVVGLKPGTYDITCDGKLVGATDEASLALGVNLNGLLLDAGHEAPWAAVARSIWEGRTLGQVVQRPWRFEVRRR
ncbi:MAG: GDSL-type esterase/lipase family protein [Isosphaeraceae bacterium]